MEIIISKKPNLKRLHRWLKYEISGSVLFVASWFAPIVIFAAEAVAIVFTPYMLFILYKERKFGWIIFFIIFIVIPLVLVMLFSPPQFSGILILIPLVFFYFYCFLLKITVHDWLT